ncbi:MAG: transposase [Nocardioidaceae bacterium]|nr:transposase [Nocardioidaceae bacterium]
MLGWTRLANDPETLVAEVLKAGEAPEVAIEATYGWYWAVDALQAAGANVHLVAPSKLTAFEGRRVKNDQRDCQVLGDLMRAKMLPEAWISTPQVREWRELVRYRAKLVGMRSGLKAHAVLAKHGMGVPMSDLFGVGGRLLAHLCESTPASTPPTGNASNHSSCSSTPSPARSTSWATRSPTCSGIMPATMRSSSSPGSGRSWPPCSSPRSVTCTASPRPLISLRGAG